MVLLILHSESLFSESNKWLFKLQEVENQVSSHTFTDTLLSNFELLQPKRDIIQIIGPDQRALSAPS